MGWLKSLLGQFDDSDSPVQVGRQMSEPEAPHVGGRSEARGHRSGCEKRGNPTLYELDECQL